MELLGDSTSSVQLLGSERFCLLVSVLNILTLLMCNTGLEKLTFLRDFLPFSLQPYEIHVVIFCAILCV